MDTKELSYQLFLAEQMSEQIQLERFIDECILLSENTNTISNIDIIHESFTDKIKETINKFLQAIANMWNKFLESMNTLLKTDRAYLEKYKDIILKKNPIESEYSMYKYDQGIPELLKTTIPVLNMNNMDKELADDESFLKAHFSSLIMNAKSPYNVSDLAKSKFRGNNGKEVTVKSTELNMTNMYNYCYDYKKLVEKIENDIKNIQKTSGDIIMRIDKMSREGEIKQESVYTSNTKYLSAVYESYITEAEEEKEKIKPGQRIENKPEEKKDDNNTPNKPSTNPSDSYQKTDKADSNQELNSEKSAKELREKTSRYLKICGDILGAKQSIAEEIYKAYMSIIKTHVRDYVGKKKETGDNKPADSATDYDNNSKDKETKDTNKPEEKKPEGKPKENIISKMFAKLK